MAMGLREIIAFVAEFPGSCRSHGWPPIVGYNNQRGVIAALEVFFGTTFNERRNFVDVVNGWLIRHYASCSGLTILKKLAARTPHF